MVGNGDSSNTVGLATGAKRDCRPQKGLGFRD